MPCVALLLFIGWSVYFHRFPAQIVSYRWLLESGIVNIGESKIKLMFWHWNTFFSFFSSSLHSFLSPSCLLSSSWFSPSISPSMFVFFSLTTKYKCKKELTLSGLETSQKKFNKSHSVANRCYFPCLDKFIHTEIYTIQLNAILRQK